MQIFYLNQWKTYPSRRTGKPYFTVSHKVARTIPNKKKAPRLNPGAEILFEGYLL
jgi:hypothetical protein